MNVQRGHTENLKYKERGSCVNEVCWFFNRIICEKMKVKKGWW